MIVMCINRDIMEILVLFSLYRGLLLLLIINNLNQILKKMFETNKEKKCSLLIYFNIYKIFKIVFNLNYSNIYTGLKRYA